ncbi:MAG TPA: response regulator, partial [Pseudomonadales bacterium]|nr:response regulator [Pseudomonadales bacterium]
MSKLNILVIDDATFIRDLIKKNIRDHFPNVTLHEALDGKKAQSLLRSNTFDLILCDWEMPEMNGEELCVWLRE